MTKRTASKKSRLTYRPDRRGLRSHIKALVATTSLLAVVTALGGCGGGNEPSTDAAKKVASMYGCDELGWRADQKDGPNGKLSLGSCLLRGGIASEQMTVQCNAEADEEFGAADDSQVIFTSDYEDFFARCILDE